MGAGNGFVWYFRECTAEGSDAVEIFDGAAVEALGLDLVAEEEFPGLRIGCEVEEAFGEGEVLFLSAAHFEIGVAEGAVEEVDGLDLAGLVEEGGEESAFEAGGAEELLLSDGDAPDGGEFLGVRGLVEGDEVFEEFGDIVEAFEDRDGEIVG